MRRALDVSHQLSAVESIVRWYRGDKSALAPCRVTRQWHLRLPTHRFGNCARAEPVLVMVIVYTASHAIGFSWNRSLEDFSIADTSVLA
jgi:hypothetical protein